MEDLELVELLPNDWNLWKRAGWNRRDAQVLSTSMVLILGGAAWFFLLQWIRIRRMQGGLKLPPGPPSWPIVGSLFHVFGSKLPIHETLGKLSTHYGPVMFLRLGSLPCVVINSAKDAEVVLNDPRFSHRATETLLHTLRYLEFDNQGFISQYTEQLKLLRKLCNTEILTTKRVASFAKVRKDQLQARLKKMASKAKAKQLVDIKGDLGNQGLNTMTEIMFKQRFDGSDAQFAKDLQNLPTILPQVLQEAGTISWPDLFPAIRWLDLEGRIRRYKQLRSQMERAYMTIIENNKIKAMNVDDDDSATFLEVLLSQQNKNGLSDVAIMATIQDLIIGGSETFGTTVQWLIAELVRSPEKMQRLQEEIDRVTGRVRQVEESDFPNLPYLIACVKEGFRLYPPISLLIPRETKEATTLNGYFIPPRTTVLVNAWQIAHDPTYYHNPDSFQPERYLDSNQSTSDLDDYHFLAFGAGRRGCVGVKMGTVLTQITLAAMVHAFDWSPPPGMEPSDIDITPTDGMVLAPKFPIRFLALPRLDPAVYNLDSCLG